MSKRTVLSESMVALGTARSEIRELFEFGKALAAERGADAVFDFSIGNPSVSPPDAVNETAIRLLREENALALHGYTSAPGDLAIRTQLADSLNRRFATGYSAAHLFVTAGAASALCACLHALACPGDEFLVLAPYFPEYKVFIAATGATMGTVPPDTDTFQINFSALEAAISPHTKAVLVNSPNNPSGVVYSAHTLTKLGELLRRKSAQYGAPIFLLSDEPYREIVFDGVTVPWLPHFYENTLVTYSFSKVLSLPGERVGYVLVPPAVTDSALVYAAVAGAARALGHVCAPSLFQQVTAACADLTADLSVYAANRRLLVDGLRALGFTCVEPDGTFYLVLKAPDGDAYAFSNRAKGHGLLLVPGDSFALPGYLRLAFCVPTDRVERSMSAFAALAAEYGLV